MRVNRPGFALDPAEPCVSPFQRRLNRSWTERGVLRRPTPGRRAPAQFGGCDFVRCIQPKTLPTHPGLRVKMTPRLMADFGGRVAQSKARRTHRSRLSGRWSRCPRPTPGISHPCWRAPTACPAAGALPRLPWAASLLRPPFTLRSSVSPSNPACARNATRSRMVSVSQHSQGRRE